MRHARRADAVALGLVVAAALVGLAFWKDLPARLAIHWGGSGPDTVVAKPLALLGIPAFGAATVAFVRLAPDSLTNTPGGETVTVLFLGVVFAWVHGVVVVWNLGYRFDVTLAVLPVLIAGGALVVYASAWNPMG